MLVCVVCRWRGSIYKLLWPELTLYLTVYYVLSLVYRFKLEGDHKKNFEQVAIYCNTYVDFIPVSFVLGFYVSIVVKRWWDSFNSIPWPDTLAFFVSAFIHGQYCWQSLALWQDDRGRLMRRTMMRYVNLALVLTLTCISPCVKKRFPTLEHLVEAGILLANEKKIFEQMKTNHSIYWMPLVWASSIATRARKEGRIRDDFALNTLVDAIANYRSLCGTLFNYDWLSIPLVYTQVVTLVVYTFFLASVMGQQYLDPAMNYKGYNIDLIFPIFNFLQFFFYMGWLKVAETLVNPFGEDDDDFEMNWVIDRDFQVSYLIVDEMHHEHPELIKDQYWDEGEMTLPYTAAAKAFFSEPYQGSASTLIVPPDQAEFVPLEPLLEGEPLEIKFSSSSRSSLAGPFHPYSQQKKSVLSMLQRIFSGAGGLGQLSYILHRHRRYKLFCAGDSSASLQSGMKAARRLSRESNISNTSVPPSPTEYPREYGPIPDDIFHLSDLSLASRSTSVALSPDMLAKLRPSGQRSAKCSTISEPPEDLKLSRPPRHPSSPPNEVEVDETSPLDPGNLT
ncbi:hypothetical protein LAZ67_14000336 [Cordylochernes scorpioides]|uniref:Bestrophin homolog n=1 Tax=Cordylochernes scorpioides TaxID=51811 RepID=A0ABY6L6L3_9ARAC|nr:hypothetical protein LAZ67_14000336 [Cordylochernes scorpioides]